MLLSKSIAVYLNLAACKLKQYISTMLKQSKVDLSPEQFLVVDILWNQGPMSQQKIADTIQKDKNSVTKLVDGLEKKGYVVRQRDSNDRRANVIVLTDMAHGMKNGAKEAGISILDKMLEGISEDELKGFLRTLDKMTANMDMLTGSKKQ